MRCPACEVDYSDPDYKICPKCGRSLSPSGSRVSIVDNSRFRSHNINKTSIYNRVTHIHQPASDAIYVEAGKRHSASFYPRRKEDLERAIHVGEGATVTGYLHSQRSVYVDAGAVILGPVLGFEGVELAANVEISRGVYSHGDIIAGDDLHARGASRLMAGLVARGSIEAGRRARLGFVLADRHVELGPDSDVDTIVGVQIRIGAGTHVGRVVCTESLHLAPNVQITAMRTISAPHIVIPSGASLMLGGQLVSEANLFLVKGRSILPYSTAPSPPSGATMVLTTLLDRDYVETIESMNGAGTRSLSSKTSHT